MLRLPSAASFKQVNKSLEPVRLQGSFGGSLALCGVVWACRQAESPLGYSILDLTRGWKTSIWILISVESPRDTHNKMGLKMGILKTQKYNP